MQTTTSLSPGVIKEHIDAQLAAYFEKRRVESVALGASYVQLWKSLETLVMAGGKRFRPYMVVLAHQAYAPEEAIQPILPAAAAQELVHQAVLIHDDIIDRDTIRYGIDNITGQYNTLYAPFITDTNERHHMATSAALLAGDILLSDAHHFMHALKKPETMVQRASDILSTAVFEVVGGELLDTEVSFLPPGSISPEIIAHYKTASYSFVSPLTMGAVLGGAGEKEVATLTELSLHLGIGYQLRDDLIGMFGDSAVTGKSTTTDITEGKRTFLVERFEACATKTQKASFAAAFHNQDATPQEIAACKQALIDSGAKAAVEAEITKHEQATRACIDTLTIQPKAKELFHGLTDKCLSREA